MAIVSDGTLCALCGAPLNPEDCFATSHFLDAAHPLAKYSDAAMHWSCYDEWPARPTFARAYFEAWVEAQARSPYWGLVYHSDRVAVAMSAPPDEVVRLSVAAAVAGVQLTLSEWNGLFDSQPALPHLRAVDRRSIVDILDELREALPDAETIRRRLDVAALDVLQRQLLEERRYREKAQKDRLRDHQERWKTARRAGVACPHCGEPRALRPVNRYPLGRSYFICTSCSRSFDAPSREE